MNIAWFRPAEPASGADVDWLADVIGGLEAVHAITRVTEDRAHDFVWQHARGWFDLCVYELDNTPRHQYMWPYLINYPGVLALQSATLHDARRARLVHEARLADYAAEIVFAGGPTHVRPPWHMARGQWPMLRVPVTASRLTAVADPSVAEHIATSVPGAAVRVLDVGVQAPAATVAGPAATAPATAVVVASVEPKRHEVVVRAVERVRAAGLQVTTEAVADVGLGRADVVVALRWPLHGRPLLSAIAAMAAGTPVIVAETYGTARWPALNPQTWQARDAGRGVGAPIVVSIDPRDEEHSLVLALRRLATDADLRSNLGRAAQAWWTGHATLGHAVASWESILAEAAALPAPPRPTGWPAHLDADGAALTRRLLAECGIEMDPVRYSPSHS